MPHCYRSRFAHQLTVFTLPQGATMPDATTGLIYSPVFAIVSCLAFSDRHCLSLGYDFSLHWLRMFLENCLKQPESLHALSFRPVNTLYQRPRIKRACVDCERLTALHSRFHRQILKEGICIPRGSNELVAN